MSTTPSIFDQFINFSRKYNLTRKLMLVLSALALMSGVATYVALTNMGPFGENFSNVLPWIYLDLALLLLLTVFIARRLVELWAKRRKGLAGSRLHIHLVALFGFVSVMPAIFVAVFAALFFNVGVKAWFSEPVKEAIGEAHYVAEQYIKEHMRTISIDALSIVDNLRAKMPALHNQPKQLGEMLTAESKKHSLAEVLIFDGNQNVVARSLLTYALEFEKVSFDAFEKARMGDISVVSSDNGDRVRALVRLDPVTDTYLYVGKFLDPEVLKHATTAQNAVVEYHRLEEQRSGLQLTFILFFSLIALLLLIAAIGVGMTLANMLIRPIIRLIEATDRVSQGDLDIQVEESAMNNELAKLARSFNFMTKRIQTQHADLSNINQQLEQRRRFMESVLSGVSAGVIGLDSDRRITLPNERSSVLLGQNVQEAIGKTITSIVPEFGRCLNEAGNNLQQNYVRQITLTRRGVARTLQVCVVVDTDQDIKKGYIISFDDVTDLLSAQRKAAWSDVARKIAHEIKNPLTPIQLSAERLKKRYLSEIHTDPVTFKKCVDTIIRQVQHIGKLVAEFSSFARMPEPVMKEENLAEICSQALFLQKQADPDIIYELDIKQESVPFYCDSQQLSQVMTNLLKNAYEAIKENNIDEVKPTVNLTLCVEVDKIVITVSDTGLGFPKSGREQLTQPYFTTRANGTGLGLAIVAKIVEDHGGELVLGDSVLLGGAEVKLSFSNKLG